MAELVLGVDSSTQSTKVQARDAETGAHMLVDTAERDFQDWFSEQTRRREESFQKWTRAHKIDVLTIADTLVW